MKNIPMSSAAFQPTSAVHGALASARRGASRAALAAAFV
jgi:hypothetical protein